MAHVFYKEKGAKKAGDPGSNPGGSISAFYQKNLKENSHIEDMKDRGEPRIIIWDIDGILIYVGDSYRKTIVNTVQYYFSECLGLKLNKYLINRATTQEFKLAGGFNDDWELTYAVILCYLSKLISNLDRKPDLEPHSGDLDEMLERLRYLGSTYPGDPLRLDLKKITRRIEEYGGGLDATEKTLMEFFGEDLKIAKKFFFPELIKRIFEEIYLGKDLFCDKYKEQPRFFKGEGLILNERPLVDLKTLLELRRKYYFGIVTGRERFEAELGLKNNFGKIFRPDLMVTREDTEAKKPAPEPLLKCKKRICKKYKLGEDAGAIYVGDSIDDLKAARNANFYFIAILSGTANARERDILRKKFHEMMSDLVIDDAKELLLYL
ncbi:MAG: hypothetical protein DRO89_04815 [Candidatus Altiarchaeales archaeon]|nr:MAG: hypothetical protein DRO89_04815 [Candidatus Altiarchaeales archaeon]